MSHPTIERPSPFRGHRTRLQRRAVADLADHPYRIELVGTLRTLAWPSICASCGTSTDERLTVRKVFWRPRTGYQRPSRFRRQIVTTVDVPYCTECAARHRALVPPRSFAKDLWRMLWPVLIPIFGASYFLMLTFRIAVEEQSSGNLHAKYVWGLPGLFAFIILWCLMIGWFSSRADRVERQTEVTRACDFSDDVSWFFERERRVYAMQNQSFAQAFGEANHDRVWSDDDDRRSEQRMMRSLAVAGVVGVAVWAFVVFFL